MSVLLTPPNSSHRTDKEKENKYPAAVAGPSTRSVVWAPEDLIHCLGTPPKSTPLSSRNRPKSVKSILKKSSQTDLLAAPEATKQRETTPEPKDPLVNLHYLDHPVQQILDNGEPDEESLRKLIEAYNVLAARLRACVADSTDADASWPLFQPLRKNADAFVDAVVRDLGRALVDPLTYGTDALGKDATCIPKFSLPSPQKSPMKKKGGLTAEQVKFARDLCTTCHSVIRLLSAVLSIKAIYSVFDDKQLGRMLTGVLAIPLADELPTPNARKTCALAIMLIQAQRLPAQILRPAADRIAYALRRGLDGELGKEGKKGSASDGLKAIHDLSVHLPDIFVPTFTPLLPSILCNLLANTFNLRTQACHALGGFVLASTKIPLSPIHTKIANTISAFVTTVAPAPSPAKPAASQSPPRIPEASIVRTLRTTLICVDPTHVAQGPIWGLSVLASFVVGLRSRLCEDAKVNRTISTLLSLAMRHKKSSVRALCCAAWRPVSWAYFQPPLPVDPDEGEDEVDKEGTDKMTREQVRNIHLKVMKTVVDMQAGVSTMAALLAEENGGTEDEALQHALDILQTMTIKPGQGCGDAEETLKHMTSLPGSGRYEVEPWDPNLLLPKALFSSSPGLLTADFANLKKVVQEVFDQLAMIHDIRYLTPEEMARPWVFANLLSSWRNILSRLEMFDETEVPEPLVQTWSNILKANVQIRQENEEDNEIIQFACSAVLHLIDIANDPGLDFRPRKIADILATVPGGSDDTIPDIDGPATLTNAELRLRVIHRLWGVMKTIVPNDLLQRGAEQLLDGLVKNRLMLVPECSRLDGSSDEDDVEAPRNSWITLCMDVLGLCYPDTFKCFWCCETDAGDNLSKWEWAPEFTRAIWKTSVDLFVDGGERWRDGIVLLGLPFSDRHAWTHSSEDYNTWEDLLTYTSAKALDDGLDNHQVLDRIASFVSHFQTPGLHPAPSMRLVDSLFSNIEAGEMSELPLEVLELASSTMRATYPPEPRNKQIGMWMVRSLTSVIEHCPVELTLKLLQALEDGLCLWLVDECETWTEDELNYDIIPLYQHILVRIQALPESLTTLRALESILDSVFTKRVLPSAVEAFKDYWNLTYARVPEPEGGWSDTIVHCLRAAGILPQPKPAEPMSTSPLTPAFIFVPVPCTPTSSSFTTPPTANVKIVSPERPQKLLPSFPIVPTTPLSPVRSRRSGSSTRTPLSAIQLCNSSARRRRHLSDGENDSEKENKVLCSPVSVADHIAGLVKFNGKKRQLESDDEKESSETPLSKKPRLRSKMKPKMGPPAKKMRVASSPAPSTASSNESEDEQWVASTLVPAIPSSEGQSTPASPEVPRFRTYSGKTKLGLANSPDVPTPPFAGTSEERCHNAILDRPATPIKKIDLTKVQFRRSVSFPESLLAAVVRGKRKRVDSFSEQDDEDLAGPSDSRPLRPLPARSARPLKRACTIPFSDSDVSVHSMSSDDDPHLGQVTPHHLVSPALGRRSILDGLVASASSLSAMKDLFGDSPESDESGVSGSDSESPTKEFVSRQLQRMGSDSRFSKTLSASD